MKYAVPSVLSNFKLVDLQTGLVEPRCSLTIEEGVITRVDDTPSHLSTARDLAGLYLLPGLISVHTHLGGVYPFERRSQSEPAASVSVRAEIRARQALSAGITTLRTMHEQTRADLALKAASRERPLLIPRILAAGKALTAKGGHGDGLGCIVAEGPDAFEDAAHAELSAGADHVKVFLTGGLARPAEELENTQLTSDEIRACVKAAHEHDTYVVAHTASAEAIRTGLACGVRWFEHAYSLDPETAALLTKHTAVLTPTLAVTHCADWLDDQGFERQSIARSEAAREEHEASIAHAIHAGVTIVNGTDFPPGDISNGTSLVVREMELLVNAGLSPLESLRASTVTAAKALRLTTTGVVAPGFDADLIAVGRDPTDDISAMRDVRFIARRGTIVRTSHRL
jgi:imidazolonepropionase-like amidohydrolase